MKKNYPKCAFCEGNCFARKNGKCRILTSMPRSKTCHFKKPDRCVTDDKYYPWNDMYKR